MPFMSLGAVTTIQGGGTPSRSRPEYFRGDIPWVTGADLTERVVTASRVQISDDAVTDSATTVVPAGTVLLLTRTSIGRVAIAGVRLAFNQDILAMTPAPERLDARYLAQFLRSREDDLVRQARGATIQGIPRAFVAELRIPLPPLVQQVLVADSFDTADGILEKHRRTAALIPQIASAIFEDYFGEAAVNPKGWPCLPLGAVADRITDGEHKTPQRTTAGVKLLSARNVRDGYIDLSDVDYVSPDEYERIARRCAPQRGDVLISCSGTIGRVATVTFDEPFGLVRSVALVRPKTDVVSSRFLEHYLRTRPLHAMMLRRANASSQANLFQNQIRELPVLLPPLPLQLEFGERVLTLDLLASKVSRAIEESSALVASLRHRFFPYEAAGKTSLGDRVVVSV